MSSARNHPTGSWLGAVRLAGALVIGAAAGGPGMLVAQDTFSGSMTFESRLFPNTGLFVDQPGLHWSAVWEPELFWSNEDGRHTLTFAPFGRYDSGDSERSHVDIRELYWQTYGDRWELSAGLLRTFWGVTESQHLVDVVNQTDFVENFDGEDKLGQPAVLVTWLADWGTTDVYLLPRFRERTFPGADGRLRFPFVVETDAAEVERTLGVAARWAHILGPVDVGLSYFYGTSREPRFTIDGAPDMPGALVPLYERVHQGGIDAQLTHESWLWKLEAISRWGQGDAFAAATAGFEYTLANVQGRGLDIGLIAEYSHDTRTPSADPTEPIAFALLDNDLFAGARVALNDVQSTEVLAGAIVDLELGSVAWLIEASRRVRQSFTADFEVRAFSNTDPEDALFSFRRDSYAQLGFSVYY